MNFLDPAYRAWIHAHKGATINWTTPNDQSDSVLEVEYRKEVYQTSAGFRIEMQLEPNQTYQLELSAQLLKGSIAFVYVEDTQQQRLVPRIKIYQNTEFYVLKHNFITLPIVNLVYLGILFYYPDIDYHLRVNKFQINKVEKLTSANLLSFQSNSTNPNPNPKFSPPPPSKPKSLKKLGVENGYHS
mgnify:CR=1 FL=1